MTAEPRQRAQWTLVDEGWGRKAVDFATLSEPGNVREYARSLASTGPAYEAIQNVGEDAFVAAAVDAARAHVRDGLPLRAEIAVVAYLAVK